MNSVHRPSPTRSARRAAAERPRRAAPRGCVVTAALGLWLSACNEPPRKRDVELVTSVDHTESDASVPPADGHGADPSDAASAPPPGASDGSLPIDASGEPLAPDAALDAGESDAAKPQPDDAGSTEPDAAVDLDAGATDRDDASSPVSDAGKPAPDAGPEPIDAGPPPPPPPATFTRVYALFRQSCRNCHLPGAAYSLDMSTQQGTYLELVGDGQGAPAEFITCANKGYLRVAPFDPDASLLVQKLEDSQPCGDQMPPGGQLAKASLELVRAWIAKGAPND